jgi:DNA-nicking Smr family endonuclease
MTDETDEPIDYPIDGILDLHHFDPKEVKELVPEYLRECLARGILDIRIIHGKGIGEMRRMVHTLLERSELVESFRLDSQSPSSWGATLVRLKKGTS